MAEFNEGTSQLIADLSAAGVAVHTVENGNTPFAVIPEDYKVVGLAEMVQNDRSERPHRIKQNVEVWDAKGFNAYFLLYRDSCSRVFADVNAATVTGILDYHEDSGDGSGDIMPRWGSHKLTLSLKKSPEWLLWTTKQSVKNAMDQDTFATFIEDNAPDIVDPSAATMKEIAGDLHQTSEMTFAAKATTPNGSQKITYAQENKSTFGKAEATVPESFAIAIPVYVGGSLVKLIARLRWRVNGGKAVFWFDLLRADAAERAAFDATRGEIESAIGTQIISGVVR